MKGTDRFLIAIVAGIALLVGAVLAIALLRPHEPGYRTDSTPEGVAHNYLLALQLEDYERAYTYLSSTLPGYPEDTAAFGHDVREHRRSFGHYDDDVSLAVESSHVQDGRADVEVRRTVHFRGGPLDSGQYSSTFDMTLRLDGQEWKVSDSDYYWARCWQSYEGCQ